MIRANCDAANCKAECNSDEVLLTAYCGAARAPAIFSTERSASCRRRGAASSPIVLACAKVAETTVPNTATVQPDTEQDKQMDRSLRNICRGC
jgi:hypothetical protein